MKHTVVAPSVGESITEVSILKWVKGSGEAIQAGELLLEVESDKATVEIVAEFSGVLTLLKQAGDRVPVGEPIGVIDTAATVTTASVGTSKPASVVTSSVPTVKAMGPAARKEIAEKNLDPSQIRGSGKDGRITKGDILSHTTVSTSPSSSSSSGSSSRGDRRVAMSQIRARIAERLVQAQHTAAILTTFNEVDMSFIMALRNQHKDAFKAKHGVALSFMSFFTRACIIALKKVPEVNASIDGRDIVYHDYCDVGIAVGSERGLVVPVVRDADQLELVQVEKKIGELAEKARNGKLSISDLSGGTFTISNGGVYGSLLSTPILTPPQAGILGMHKIQERPVVIHGKVEVRPMMYLALSYDHRLIDGKGAVTFLVALREALESPASLGGLEL